MNVLAQNKGLTLTSKIEPNVPNVLSGDSARIQQIVVNLVSNAIKFTHEGEIVMRLYCPDEGHWAIQIADTGPGIPVKDQAAIFEPFQQVDGSITREYRGSGLGLSIVKQLTLLMHGQIKLESKLGQGSVFTVELPLHPILEK